jgi:periplasmic divalent cation tolerance protein
MKMLIVFCNAPDAASAEAIATALVTAQLAACVNILAPCRSLFRWDGRIETADEIPLVIKTTQQAYPRVEEQIRALHPYQVPEIIACPIEAGLPSYLTWVADNVFSSDGSD